MFWWLMLLLRYSLGSILILTFIFLNKKLRYRRRLERDHGPLSVKDSQYNYWFHVSSEGELEQVLPLINGLQSQLDKKDILLLYTSDSLLKKMTKIEEEFPSVVTCMVPLLNFFCFGKGSISKLSSPKVFFMVRYDFFPELILKGRSSDLFLLVSASLKGKMRAFKRNKLKKVYYGSILKSYDEVFAAGPQDFDRINEFFNGQPPFKLEEHDFRHGQIIERQKTKVNYEKSHCMDSFQQWLGDSDLNSRIIFGSLWPNELEAFSTEFISDLKQGKERIFLAPHKLSGPEWESIEQHVEAWKELGIGVCEWNKYGIQGNGPVLLCQIPGILCEVYPFFGHCYIGGGHGRSVHSLLEPYWGGGHIYCGPKTHRSTEFDYVTVKSPRHLHVVNELTEFYSIYKRSREIALDYGVREQSSKEVMINQAKIIDRIFRERS